MATTTTTTHDSPGRPGATVPAARPARDSGTGPVLAHLTSLVREHGFEPLRIEGTMPRELSGTFYRNAPARFDVGASPHWFDAQGAVSAVRFADGRVQGANKVVHTPSGDHDLGRESQRYGAFRQRMSWRGRLKALVGGQGIRNAANINVLPWQDKLFAMYETTLPVEIDPETLESRGETNLGGVIKGAWNAHPRRVPSRQATYQFGMRIGPRCFIDVYELPDKGNVRLMTSFRLPGVVEMHDMFATENYLVFAVLPYWSSSLGMLANGSYVDSLVERKGQPTRFVVIPIDEPHRHIEIECEPFFFWHSLNAYDDGGRIVLDFIRYDGFVQQARWIEDVTTGQQGGHHGGSVVRYVLDPIARTSRRETLHERCGEFPVVSPRVMARPYRYGWMAGFDRGHDGHGWFDRIARIDVDSGSRIDCSPGSRATVGEPVLVPRSEREDDVWVLAFVRDLDRGASCVAVWDGASGGEPVARAWFADQLPAGLHGTWVTSAS
jgi:all-trans-8'-apo-beta-carotenal 15,15'-oxygenase